MHSAISSSSFSVSPQSLFDDEIHSLLHVYSAPVPQHRANFPGRTGFQRACRTGFECRSTLLNFGANRSDGEGNE